MAKSIRTPQTHDDSLRWTGAGVCIGAPTGSRVEGVCQGLNQGTKGETFEGTLGVI